MTTNDEQPISHLASVLKPFVQREELVGVVAAVADKDRILSLDAAGYSDLAKKKKIRPDTMFWIASMTKPITATAMMLLVDEGKLAMNDPVAKYLPEFQDLWLAAEQTPERMTLKRPSRIMTIRDLLSHTSGMVQQSVLDRPTLDLLKLRDLVLGYSMIPLEAEPGTKYAYSNVGMAVAGRVIEVVSGMSYEAFLELRLFGPLGMTDTTFWPSKKQCARLAKAYRPNPENNGFEEFPIYALRQPYHDRSRHAMPGGGLFSTVIDMMRFCRMLMNGGVWEGKQYISQAAINEMTCKQPDATPQRDYGLGWQVGETWYGHGGALLTNMSIDLTPGLVTVYLVQLGGYRGNGNTALPAYKAASLERFARVNS